MENSKLDTIMAALSAMNIERERMFKQTEELNSRLCGLEAKLQQSIHQTSATTMQIGSSSSLQAPAVPLHPSDVKEPRISLPEKFDGTRSKFRGFVNQVRLIFLLQPQRYTTDATRIGLVGTLLTGQALSWFAPLYEKNSSVLESFDTFLAAFEEAFSEHDKARAATMKIRNLRQGRRPASIYASDFRQLACDIEWGEPTLVSQFYHGLRDEVKDLLLSLPDPTTVNEAISQAVKCDNRLFERQQEKRLWTTPRPHLNYDAAATTNLSNKPSEVEDMQIDAVRFKPLTEQEKKRRRQEGLCLYCGGEGHKLDGCSKRRQRTSQVRTANIQQENEDFQPQ